jgi:hypothetical protein
MTEAKATLSQEHNLVFQSLYTVMLLLDLSQKTNGFFDSEFFKTMAFTFPQMKEELKGIGIDNQGCALMSLYAMLVIPKELFWDQCPEERNRVDAFLRTRVLRTTTTYKKDAPTTDFLRHVRNSVAHARVSFRPSEVICFFDENPGTGEKFSTELPLNQLGAFLHELLIVHKALHQRLLA